MTAEDARLAALAQQIRREADMVAHPTGAWVEPLIDDAGRPVYDVAIVGAGQCGLATAQGLIRDGITNFVLIDRNPAGFEGPWATYARMDVLRTPKVQVGLDHGLPGLTTQAWYEAKYGPGTWVDVDHVGREDWMAYLRWYRKVLNLPVRNGVELTKIEDESKWLKLSVVGPEGAETLRARRLVLATGYEGSGPWHIPPVIAASVPPERCLHSNTIIDFARFRGKRVGVLGHGAGAFDAALAALRHGATAVDLCFRRALLPTINPHRVVEFVGFLKHYPEAADAVRWSTAYHFDVFDQPPPRRSFEATNAFPNFALHPGSPWLEARLTDGAIIVSTPQRIFTFDEVICATGSTPDLARRPELAPFAAEIALWRDRYTPPAEEAHEMLGCFPYLGPHYEFQARTSGAAPFLDRIHAYNLAGFVSMGPHSTSLSGHKYSVPRLIRGLTRSLFLEQQERLLPALRAHREREIEWAPAPPSGTRRTAAE